MGLGFSRDDAGKFIKDYVNKNIFEKDPFQTLDQEGVGELVKIAVEKVRQQDQILSLEFVENMDEIQLLLNSVIERD